MLPEYILKEERSDNFPLLFVLGFVSAIGGFVAASALFPSESSLLAVIFASIPLVYPLMTKFLGDEKKEGESYFEEVIIYGALFLGQSVGFTLISLVRPEALQLQAEAAGIAGRATAPGLFFQILSNNLTVFTGILTVSAVIGSAGAFILVWNASVLGKFFGSILSQDPGNLGVLIACGPKLQSFFGVSRAGVLCYLPHAAFEMSGFITAGIAGSLISSAVYRNHFDKGVWTDYVAIVVLGLSLILTGAGLETGVFLAFLIGLVSSFFTIFYLIYYGESPYFK